MYIAVGGAERLLDSARFIAQIAARQEVSVVWEEYEMMPHIFPLLFKQFPQSRACMRRWAKACLNLVEDAKQMKTQGTIVGLGGQAVENLDVKELTTMNLDEAVRAMRAKVIPFIGRRGLKTKL